ncbi:MAG TPA: hypothetical protein VI670_13665 [Thermoanaerobaculia bacterium]|jgi:hypothetical protein
MAKPKKKEEPERKKEEPAFVGPPLRPGLPAFFRWKGYFKVGPGDVVKDIEKFRKRRGGM